MTWLIIAAIVLGALLALAWPRLSKRSSEIAGLSVDDVERRIADYRAALEAGTVCDRCLRDNPSNARFCAECGNLLRQIAGAQVAETSDE